MIKLSKDSLDTIEKLNILEVLAPLHIKYSTSNYEQLYNKVMSTDNFANKVAILAHEPKEVWIKRLYLTIWGKDNLKLRIVK